MKQFLLLVVLCGAWATSLFAQSTFSGSGNWDDPLRWSAGVPGAGTAVTIAVGATCTVNINNAQCASLAFAAGATNSLVTMNTGSVLAIGGAITYSDPGTNNITQVIAVNDGTLSCASVSMVNPGGVGRTNELTLSTGTITISGSLTAAGAAAENLVTFSNSGKINIGGNFVITNWTFTPSTGTVCYNGVAQNIYNTTYNILELAGSNTKTFSGATIINSNLNITGTNITILDATALTVTGNLNNSGTGTTIWGGNANTSTISGNLAISNNTTFRICNTAGQAKTFNITGDVNIGDGSTLNVGAVATTNLMTVNGNFIIDGTLDFYQAAGQICNLTITGGAPPHTFTGTPDATTQFSNVAFNSNTTSTSYDLDFDGTVTIAAGITLDAGARTLYVTGASWTMGAGGAAFTSSGTVIFDGAAQSIASAASFYNIEFAGSNTKTINSGTLTVNNDFNITAASLTFTTNQAINISRNFNISGTPTIWGGNANTTTISGDLVVSNNSTFTICNTAGQAKTITVNNVQVGSNCFILVGAVATTNVMTINGSLTNDGTFDMYTAATQICNVTFATNTPHSINGTPVLIQFNNLTLGATSNTTTANYILDIEGNVAFNASSTFASGNYTHTIAGNWTGNATGTHTSTGIIKFDGAAQTIAGPTNFYNIELAGSNTKTINTGTITVGNDFNISAASLTVTSNQIINITRDYNVTGSSATITPSGAVTVTRDFIVANTATTTTLSPTAAFSVRDFTVSATPFVLGGTANTTTISRNLLVNTNSTFTISSVSPGVKTINVTGDVTVESGSTINVGTFNNTNLMNIAGNLIADGIFNMFTAANQLCNVTFSGAGNTSISGLVGGTASFNTITINKGVDQTSILDVTRIISMQSPAAGNTNNLTLTNGTFKLSSGSTLTPYYGAITVCAGTARLWLNHASANVSCVGSGTTTNPGAPTVTGTLQVTHGTFSYGSGNDWMVLSNAATAFLIIEGADATVNVYGGLNQANANATLTITDGNLNIDCQRSDVGGDNITAAGYVVDIRGKVNFNGGKLTIVDPTAYVTADANSTLLLWGTGVNENFTGSTIQFGDGISTTSGGNTNGFSFRSNLPNTCYIGNLILDTKTGTNRHVLLYDGPYYVGGNVTINSDAANDLRVNSRTISIQGNLTNSGKFTTSGANSSLILNGTTAQTVSGAGTFTDGVATPRIMKLTVDNTSGVTPAIDVQCPITPVTTYTLTTGSLNTSGAGAINLGIGAGTLTITRANGSLLATPTWNLGGVTLNMTYNASTAPISTTYEIPPTASGSINNITINNAQGITLNMASVTVNGTFTLTSGVFDLSTNNLYLGTAAAFAGAPYSSSKMIGTSSTGKLWKALVIGANNFTFPIGETTNYTPVALAFATNVATGNIGVNVVATQHPSHSFGDYLNRYWRFATTGLTNYTYVATYSYNPLVDITGTESLLFTSNYLSGTGPWTPDPGTTVSIPASTLTTSTLSQTSGSLNNNEVTAYYTDVYYRTKNSGNWNSISPVVWQYSEDPTFTTNVYDASNAAPTYSNNSGITIRNGHQINLTAAATADQLTLQSGGILYQNTFNLNIYDGTGDDYIIDAGGIDSTVSGQILAQPGTVAIKVNGKIATPIIEGLNVNASSTISTTNAPDVQLGANSIIGFGGTANQKVDARTDYGFLSIYAVGAKVAQGAMTVRKNLSLASGGIEDNGNIITVNGDVVNTGLHQSGPGTGSILVTGGAGTHSIGGNGTYANIELDDAVNGANLTGSFTTTGTFTFTNGNLNLNAKTLTSTGTTPFARASGKIVTDITSSLVFNANGVLYTLPNDLFTTTPASFNNFTVNRVGGVKLSNQSILINGTLTLSNGIFDLNNNDITFQNGGSPILPLPTIGSLTVGATSNITFGTPGNTGGAGYTLPSTFFTSNPATFNNLTINRTNSLTLNTQDITLGGNLTITAGTLADAGRTITINGNVSIDGIQSGVGNITLSGGSLAHTLSGAGTYNNIVLSDNNGANLGSNIALGGVLTLTNGLLTLGTRDLTLATAASIAGSPYTSSNMIVADNSGQLKKTYNTGASSFLFPIGDALGFYCPATINFSANAAVNTVGIKTRTVAGGLPDLGLSDNYSDRVWTFSATSVSTYTYIGTFVYDALNVTGLGEDGFFLQRVDRGTSILYTDFTSSTDALNHILTTGSITQAAASGKLDNVDFTSSVTELYYWSKATGNWNGAGTWETTPTSVEPAVGGGTATAVPPTASNSLGIKIRQNHDVTLTASYIIDQFTMQDAGSSLIMNGNNLTLRNGVGTDLTIGASTTLSTTGGQIIPNAAGTTIDISGTVSTSDADGFSGTASTTISSANTPSITLNSGSIVDYARNGIQTITPFTGGYKNLTVSTGNTKTASAPITVTQNLSISAGTLADGGNTITVNGNVTNAGTHSGTGKLLLTGGSAAHTITAGAANPFGNVELDDLAQGATVATNFTTSGSLTLTNGVFTMSNGTMLYYTSDLPIIRNGTTQTGTITLAGTSLLQFGNLANQGGAAFIIPNGTFTSAPTFNTFTLYRTNQLTLGDQNITPSTLTITAGTLADAGRTIFVNGTVSVTGAITGAGKLELIGNNSNISGAGYITNLSLAKTAGQSATLTSAFDIRGNITITTGNMTLNGQTLTTAGNIDIASACTFTVNSSAILKVASGKTITNVGILALTGAAGTVATLTQNPAAPGQFSISQTSGTPTLTATYVDFNYCNLVISVGTISASPNNLSYCTFSNGTGNDYINFDAYASSVSPTLMTFNAGPTYNIRKTSGAGIITITGYDGALSGEANDDDNAANVVWVMGNTYYSKTSGLFSTVGNWALNSDGSGASPIAAELTNGVCSFVIRDGFNMTVSNATAINIYNLQVGQGAATTMVIGTAAANVTFTIRNNLTIFANASVTVAANNATHTFNVYGDITNNGTLDLFTTAAQYATLLIYSAGAPGHTISGNSPQLAAFTLVSNSGTTTASTALDIEGNVIINGGSTFADGSQSHTMAGNYTELLTGSRTGAGTITFDGAAQTITDAVGCTLNNVTINSGTSMTVTGIIAYSGTVNVNQNTSVSSTTTVNSTGTLNINGGFTYTSTGNLSIAASGILYVKPLATLTMGNGTTITNAGTFKTIGTAGNIANVKTLGAAFSISQTAGTGVMYANYTTFTNLGLANAVTGIKISAGTINATDNFSNCTFTTGTGNQYLDFTGLDLGGDINISNVVFGTGPTYNMSRPSVTGVGGAVTFTNASGALFGENYDNDNANPGIYILWSNPGATYYSFNTGTHLAGKWDDWTTDVTGASQTGHPAFDGTEIFIVRDGYTMTLETTNPTFNCLELQVGEVAGLGTAAIFSFSSDNIVTSTATIQSKLDVKSNGTLNSSLGSLNTLNINGNIYNAGSINLRTASNKTVTLYLSGSPQINGPVAPVINTVTFQAGCSSTTNVDLTIKNSITFQAGSRLTNTNRTISVEGTWTENLVLGSGGALLGTGTVAFNGSSGAQIANAVDTIVKFNNVTFSGGILHGSSENIWVTGDLTISGASTEYAPTMDVRVEGNFTLNAGTKYTQDLSGNTWFLGAGAQSIALNGTSCEFYDLSFYNGSPTVKTISGGGFRSNRFTRILANAVVAGAGTYNLSNTFYINGTCNFSGTINQNAGNLTSTTAGAATIALNSLTTYNILANVSILPTAPATSLAVSTIANMTLTNNATILTLNSAATLSSTGLLTLDGNSSVTTYVDVYGTDNFPTFTTYSLNPLYSQVRYRGTMADQKVRGGANLTYGQLYLFGAGCITKTVTDSLNVESTLWFNNSVQLNLNGLRNRFAGSIRNNGSAPNITNGTLILDADNTAQTIEAGTYNLTDLVVTANNVIAPSVIKTFNAGSTYKISGNFITLNTNGSVSTPLIIDFTTNGFTGPTYPATFKLNPYCRFNTQAADAGTNFFGRLTAPQTLNINSTVLYNAAGPQYIASQATYGNLELANTFNKTANGALTVLGDILTNGGTPAFVDGGYTHNIAGNFLLTAGSMQQAYLTGTINLNGVNQDVVNTNFNNLTITNTGTATLTGAVTAPNINIYGIMTISNNARFDASSKNIYIYGDWIGNSAAGRFMQTTGTVTFVSTTAIQSLSSNAVSYFGNLTITKNNGLSNHKLTITSTTNIDGNLTLTASRASLDITNQTVYVGGNFYHYINSNILASTFTSTGSTMIFDGGIAQNIYQYNDYPLTFNNVQFSNAAGTKSIGYDAWKAPSPSPRQVYFTGNVTIDPSVPVSADGIGGNGNSVDIYVAQNWTNSGTFTHTRTVYFNGGTQNIGSSTFYNIDIQGTLTKTLQGNITVNNNIIINSTLDANLFSDDSQGNYTITVRGNWDNTNNSGVFTPRNGLVSFDGSSAINSDIFPGNAGGIPGDYTGKKFWNLDISKGSNWARLRDSVYVQNDFSVTSGTFITSQAAAPCNLTVCGNYTNAGTITYNNGSCVLNLRGTGAQTFDPGPLGTTVFRRITVNAVGGTYTVQNDFSILTSDFAISNGTWDLNGKAMTVGNTASINILVLGGTFDIDAGASVIFSGNDQQIKVLNASSILKVVGTAGAIATIAKTGGYYSINQTNGKIHAKYCKFDQGGNVAPARVTLTISGGTIDNTEDFDYSQFSGGLGTCYMLLTGLVFADFTVTDVVFNTGPTFNVTRTGVTGQGTIIFENSSGSLTGEGNDNDDANPGTLITFTFPNGFFWDRGAGTDNWEDDANWLGNTKPDENSYVYLEHTIGGVPGIYTVNVNAVGAKCYRLMMDPAGGAAINLTIATGSNLNIDENFQMGTGCTLTQTDATSTINLGGNWTNSGTGTYTSLTSNSTITFDGPAGSYIISPGGIAAGKLFYNVTINATATSIYQLAGAANFSGNLTITKGELDLVAATYDITVAGNLNVMAATDGVLTAQAALADVTLNGVTQDIKGGSYYNLLIAGSGTKTVKSSLDISNDLTLGNLTTLDGAEQTISVGRHWVNNGGVFTQLDGGLGSVIFDGTVAQNIDFPAGGTATTFNNVIFENTGSKTFYRDDIINGDWTISGAPLCGTVNVNTYAITSAGLSPGNFLISGATTLQIRGANNFPTGFASYSLSSSTVQYISDLATQTIRVSPAWEYNNLTLSKITQSNPAVTKQCESGLLSIGTSGTLAIQSYVTLDMATNDASVEVKNSTVNGWNHLTIGATSASINWGTGNSTLYISAYNFSFPALQTTYNNLDIRGTSSKRLFSNLTVTGNMSIGGTATMLMTDDWWSASRYMNPYTITCTGSAKTFSMSNGSALYNCTPSATAVAMPIGFQTYSLGTSSSVVLESPTGGAYPVVNQTIATRSSVAPNNQIRYGNLTISNIARTITTDGLADLNVDGNFSTGTLATFSDGNINCLFGGTTNSFNSLTSFTATKTQTFDGTDVSTPQLIQTTGATATINFTNLAFTGSGTTKTTSGNGYTMNITKSFTNAAGVLVTRANAINFTGTTWTDNGTYEQTANTLTFDNTGAGITIIPGTSSVINGVTMLPYFNNVTFNGTNTTAFNTRGIDVNGTFLQNAGTLNMSTLTHVLAGNLSVTAGTFTSTSASFTFDGVNQSIVNATPSATFNAANVTISGTGTKRQFSNWNLSGDLLINTNTTLNNSDAVVPTYYSITCAGNWTATGTYTHNSNGTVTFDATTSVNIDNGANTFYNCNFGNSVGPAGTYLLTAASTTIIRASTIASDAYVDLNGKTLILGTAAGGAGKLYTIAGTLDVDADAYLKFDNTTNVCTMTVTGTLIVKGTGTDHVATITQQNTRGHIIQITTGTIRAKYYTIEYLANTGLDVQAGATVHATDNFSYGTWSGIQQVNPAKYLNLESNNFTSSNLITDVTFNCTFAPTATQQYNVYRITGTAAPFDTVSFYNVTGNIAGATFEKDNLGAAYNAGKLRWQNITNATWTGLVSEDWDDPNNWSPIGIVLASTNVTIPIPASNNNPRITGSHANCKNITLTNGRLTLENGYSLTTAGDVIIGGAAAALNGRITIADPNSTLICGGAWTRGTYGRFTHGNGTVIFRSGSSSATIIPLESDFYNLTFDNAGTTYSLNFPATSLPANMINVLGNLVIVDATTVVNPNTNTYTLNVGGDFTNDGIFNPTQGGVTQGTVEFNKAGAQTIKNGKFYVLKTSGSGTKLMQSSLTVADSTYLTSTSTLQADAGCAMTFNGNMNIISTAGFNDGGQTHVFKGLYWTGDGTYTGTGTISFDRTTANQGIRGTNVQFNNLIANCIGRNFNVYSNTSLTGNFTIKNGIADAYQFTNTINNSNGLGTFTIEGADGLYLTGANNFPSNFATYTLAATSTVYYNGSLNQFVYGVNSGNGTGYGNLSSTGVFTRELSDNITVQGNLIFNNSTIDVSTNNYTIEIGGAFNNSYTTGGLVGTFIPHSGEVIFNGGGAQAITVGNSSTVNPFYHVTINKTAGTVTAPANVATTIGGNLDCRSGIFSANAQTVYVTGDMTASSGTFATSGTYYLNKASGTATLSTNGSTLNILTINSSGGCVYTYQDASALGLNVNGNFTLTAGTFDGNGKTINIGDGAGTDIITIDGTYKVGADGRLALGSGSNLSVNGTIEVVGSSGHTAYVTHNSSGGNYGFSVNGTIKASWYQFEYMNSGGIYVTSSGTIAAAPNNFSYGTFANSSGTVCFRVENTQDFTTAGGNAIQDVSFPGPSAGVNVRKILAVTGTLEFWNSTGSFSGATKEQDPSNIINWTGPVTVTWDGDQADNDWYNSGNWSWSNLSTGIPTGVETVIIPPVGGNYPIITATGALTANLTVSGTLIISTPAGINDIDVNGSITVTGTLRLNTINDYMTVSGNWTTAGTVNNNGNVTLDATTASIDINNGANKFYNLTLAGSTSYQLRANTVVDNDLTIVSGATLDVTSTPRNLTVKGSYSNAGYFTCWTGTVTFGPCSGTKTINTGSSVFNNVDISAGIGNTYQLITSDMSIKGSMNVNAGTFELNSRILNLGDGIATDNLYVNNNGILKVGANSSLKFGSGAVCNINTGGTFKALGTDASNIALVSRQSAGTYTFDVLSNGTLEARYYQFEYMNMTGINLQSGSLLAVYPNNLSDGKFKLGTSSGTYLTLLSNVAAATQIDNVTFDDPVSGSITNVTRTSGTNFITFNDASGNYGDYSKEHDDEYPSLNQGSGLLVWGYVNTWIWGGSNGDWSVGANWTAGTVPPDNTKNVIIGAGNPHITSASVAKKITISSGRTLYIDNNSSLTVNEDITFAGAIVVNAASSPVITANDWACNAGSFTAGLSKVLLNATTVGSKTITACNSFYDLEIAAGGSTTYKLGQATTVSHTLTLTTGTLQANSFDLTIGNSWVNTNGTFTASTGKEVLFTSTSGTSNITPRTSSFYNLRINGSGGTFTLGPTVTVTNDYTQAAGTVDVGTTLSVGNDVTFSGGTLNANGSTISCAHDWKQTAGTFSPGTGTVSLTGTSTRTLKNSSSSFKNLTITNGTYQSTTNTLAISGDLTISSGGFTTNKNVSLAGNLRNDAGASGFAYTGTPTFTFNGAALQTVRGVTSFYDVTINNGTNKVELYDNAGASTNISNMTVNHVLTFSGVNSYLNLGKNTLTFPAWIPTAIGGDDLNHFIIYTSGGTIVITGVSNGVTASFPVSLTQASTGYCGVKIANNNPGSNSYTFNNVCNNVNPAGTCATDPLNNIRAVDYTWDIISAATNATVSYYWDQSKEKSGFNRTNCHLNYFTGGAWVDLGSSGTATNYSGTVWFKTGTQPHFTGGGVADDGTNLPIDLLFFNAEVLKTNNQVNLTWATASETDNDFFTIERSTDGVNFIEVAKINGAGNSNKLIEYSYLDTPPAATTYYYRLKQTDYNGKFEYSEIVVASKVQSNIGELAISIYPNPTAGTEGIYVNFNGIPENEIITIQISDLTGKLVYDNRLVCPANPFFHFINFNNTITAGTYIVTFKGSFVNKKERLIVR